MPNIMLKQNKKLHFWFKSGIFTLLAFGIAFSTMPYRIEATWGGSCAGFTDGGSLTVTVGQTCTLTGAGTATDVTVDVGGTLEIGDGAGTGGDLTVNTTTVTIEGDLVIDSDSSFNLTSANDFTLQNGGTVTNDGDFDVAEITEVFDDGTTFTNNGTFTTDRLEVGFQGIKDGGEFINNGIAEAINSVIGSEAILVNEGKITNNALANFRYESRMIISGAVTETGVFQNFGVVDAGQDALGMLDYSLLDLDAGRFVMNEEACSPSAPAGGYVNIRSLTGTAADAMIDIADGASMSTGVFELGWDGNASEAKVINAGTIEKTDVAGNPLDCPFELNLFNDSEFENSGTIKTKDDQISMVDNATLINKTGGLIDLEEGSIRILENNTFTTESESTITGLIGTATILVDDASIVFNHSGAINNINNIQLKGAGAAGGPIFNALNGSTTSVAFFGAGNASASIGGTLNVNAGAQITATNNVLAEGYGIINADGQIDAGGIYARGGNASGGATVNLSDTSDIYEFGIISVENGVAVNTITIDPGVEVNLTTPIDVGGGEFTSGVIGSDAGTGESKLIVNGTLRTLDDPGVESRFLVGGVADGTIEIGPNGFFDYNEQGDFIVASLTPFGLIDNSDNLVTEGFDIEGNCILDGNADLNNRLDCVDLIHVQDDGDIDVGLDAVITAEGSETIVDGFVELDGIWNAGNLTVNNGGHITSSNDPTYTQTNFLLNVEDLIVNTGGQIASDGVSSSGAHLNGAGSYGGAGKGRTDNSVYGQVKMDETFTPLYGEAGIVGGVAEQNGGGAVRVHSTGSITVDGRISANGVDTVNPVGHSGSGGTVIIVHEPTDPDAFFNGIGDIEANGAGSNAFAGALPGGGGRMSLYSPFLDLSDNFSYDFQGDFEVWSGENNAAAPAEYAATGTMFFGGDTNNPNGTLFVHQVDNIPDVETTYIPNTGDNTFDKIEAIGQAIVNFAVDPTPPTVCYQTNGTINFPTLSCDDYKWPDKPHTLFVNTQATGAQGIDLFQEPGYQIIDGVSDDSKVIADIMPAFSFIHANPVDPAVVITQIQVQVDDDADFSSPIWDYLKADLKQDDGGDIVDGSRTEDIIYNEDGLGTALTEGLTYYIRAKFINAPGLWSHADYNNQWKFVANVPVPPGDGGVGGNPGPGGGSKVIPYVPPVEEPEEEPAEEPEADTPVEEPSEDPVQEPVSEETSFQPLAPEQQPESQPSEPESEAVKVKVPRKLRPAAPEQDEEITSSCSRAGVTETIINEFDLYNVNSDFDAKCQEDWDNCMLPFLINSNFDATVEYYYSDVFNADEIVGDGNPLPPVRPEDLVGDSNPLPPVKVKAIEFGTRNRMVQGYYEEEGSPFRPDEIMSRIEILKLLNFVIGLEWKYYEEYITEIGGEENLQNVVAKAGDISEWWHVRYYNYACENGLVPCDTYYDFEPQADCTDEWLNEMIGKYKKFYSDRGLDEVYGMDDDNDSLSNKEEADLFLTDPQSKDSDEDELDDGDEIFTYNTNPLLKDTDFDGLTDGDEVNKHQTDPTRLDTDGDGASDLVEINNGTDPRDPLDTPDIEIWKDLYEIDLANGSQDSDLDGLSDLLEYKYGTDPLNPDTDGDGLTDSDEILLYNTDPLSKTELDDLGVMITNLKNGMILTDLRPLIQGIAPNPDMEILVILRNAYGHELQLGKTTTDEKGVFVMTPEFDLRNGEFFLLAKALDPDNMQVYNSPMVKVSLDSSLMVEKPNPERLADKLITEEILLKELSVEVGSKMPTLTGMTGYKNQVVATWQSAVGVSSIIADISAGEFHITAPIELPFGEHKVTAYAIRESDQAMSKIVGIPFNVKETEKQVVSFEPVKEDSSYILYIFLGVIVVMVVGLVYYIRSRKPTNTLDSDSSGTEDTTNTNQNDDGKDVI